MNAGLECQAAAACLRALRPLMAASQAGAIMAGVGLSAQPSVWLIASLGLWACGLYLSVRVSLDAELLNLLAADPVGHPAQLDDFLVRASLVGQPVSRSVEQRCQGALRWGRWLVLALVAQLALGALEFLRRAL